MNKKLNTVLFLLLGTLLNIVVMMILLFVLLYLVGSLLSPTMAEGVKLAIFFGVVIVSVGGAYFVYKGIVNFVNNKWDLERWIEPIFKRKRR